MLIAIKNIFEWAALGFAAIAAVALGLLAFVTPFILAGLMVAIPLATVLWFLRLVGLY